MDAPDDDDVMSLFRSRDFQAIRHHLTPPEGLSTLGQKAARAIMSVACDLAMDPTARVFYTPEEWVQMGHKQGGSADLIIVLSGHMDTAEARAAIGLALDRIKMSSLPLSPNAVGVYPASF